MTKKKILLCLLIGAMAMSFASCNENANDDESDEDTAVITTAPNDESDVETTTTTTAPTTTTTTAPTTTTTTATTTQTPVKTPEREREEIEDKIMKIFGMTEDEVKDYFKKVFVDDDYITFTKRFYYLENTEFIYVYKNENSRIDFLDIPWNLAKVDCRINNEYVYELCFFVGTDVRTIANERAENYDITESEADSYYLSAYNKLVEMYGEPTGTDVCKSSDYHKRYCFWDNTVFGGIAVYESNPDDNGNSEVFVCFMDPNFDYSTLD